MLMRTRVAFKCAHHQFASHNISNFRSANNKNKSISMTYLSHEVNKNQFTRLFTMNRLQTNPSCTLTSSRLIKPPLGSVNLHHHHLKLNYATDSKAKSSGVPPSAVPRASTDSVAAPVPRKPVINRMVVNLEDNKLMDPVFSVPVFVVSNLDTASQ